MDKENLIELIEVIHKDFITSALQSVKDDILVKEENKRFPNLYTFNINNIDNFSLLCRNKFFMKKFYDESTPSEKKHDRTLGNEYELLGSYILCCYELDLYNPLLNEDSDKKDFDKEDSDNKEEVLLENSILNTETVNFINLFMNIFNTLKACNKNKIKLIECCHMLRDQYNSISCISNISFYDWFMSLFSRKKKYENKYLKYKKKYIELKCKL